MSRSSPPSQDDPAPRVSSNSPISRSRSERTAKFAPVPKVPAAEGKLPCRPPRDSVVHHGLATRDHQTRPWNFCSAGAQRRTRDHAGDAAYVGATCKASEHSLDPQRIDSHVIVGIGDYLTRSMCEAKVSCSREPWKRFADILKARIGTCHFRDQIACAVIHGRVVDDDEVQCIVLQKRRSESRQSGSA